jgi:polyhydroxyalkanoate synthase
MAWNADATRLPYRMHSEYLRKLFLDNDFAEGRYIVEGRPISLSDFHTPMFVVGTLRDHVAPWKSTYKSHFQVDADVTYLLTSGGHNTGIVVPPTEARHSYRAKTKAVDAVYIGPDEWLKTAQPVEASWWLEWTKWLAARSGEPSEPPRIGIELRRLGGVFPGNQDASQVQAAASFGEDQQRLPLASRDRSD